MEVEAGQLEGRDQAKPQNKKLGIEILFEVGDNCGAEPIEEKTLQKQDRST